MPELPQKPPGLKLKVELEGNSRLPKYTIRLTMLVLVLIGLADFLLN